ncbi:hypothetical protein GY24_06115 [Microterricola pindariensis]|uniref:Signal transduction histidine kinase subgroup 3 dimerisation and phosphoacceptor domain-containing protein n=2 Tax=Microterricola pindariensis TaxID=478010 RepID=A0ABX5AWX2_9MICO|nr:hypothetical protein GY24_06115 [Microterricola pindariensis]
MRSGSPRSAPSDDPRREPAARNFVDVSSLLMLHGAHASVILVLFLVTQALLAFAGESNAPWASALAFASLAAAAIWVMQPAADPFPRPWWAGILALCIGTVVVQSVQPLPPGAPLSATWHLGAVTTVLLMLILRGRVLVGWVGYLGMAAATLAWTSATGHGLGGGLDLLVRHAATLIIGTAIYFGLLSTARRIGAFNRRGLHEAAAVATAQAAEEERFEQVARLDQLARPLMERVASGAPLSASEKRECLLTEASLRDLVRGRTLAVPTVLAAVNEARARGVDVTLLDDSDGTGDPAPVAALITRELGELRSGSLTARLQPPGRSELASIVIAPAEGAARILVVEHDGRVR